MPRERSPDSIKAEKLYNSGMSLVDIAKKLGKPPGTVRRWKSSQNWDGESERSDSKASVRKQSRKKRTEVIAKEVEQVINNPDLTDKQRLFCLYYSRSFNATVAYQKSHGVDYDTANANGYKLLSNMVIRDEIMRLKKGRMIRELITEEDIFEKYMKIAFSDITNYVEFGNENIEVVTKSGDTKEMTVSYVNIRDSSQVDGTLISEVSQGRDGVKVKLLDPQKALDWLADHMYMATEEQRARVEHLRAQTEKLKDAGSDDDDEKVVIINDV